MTQNYDSLKINSRSIYLEVVYRKVVRDTEIMSAEIRRTVSIGTIGKLKKNGSFRTGLYILEWFIYLG